VFTLALSLKLSGIVNGTYILNIGSYNIAIYINNSTNINLQAKNSSGTSFSGGWSGTVSTSGGTHLLLASINTYSASDCHLHDMAGGMSATTSSTYNRTIDLASKVAYIGKENSAGHPVINGDIGFLYLDTSYIDFSQESNRNLFVDQLGYPKDLTPAIDAGTIPNPLIYMKFDDTSALGTNSGTGGNFTVNGTVTAGADVDPN
jgi:hypothetical protein